MNLALRIVVLFLLLLPCSLQERVSSDDAALREIKTVLEQLIQLSKTQALNSGKATNIFTGEAAGWTFPTFGTITEQPDTIRLIDANNAVARFLLTNPDQSQTDVYIYLKLNTRWQVTAVRLLALTGVTKVIQTQLRAKQKLTVEEQQTLANADLMLATDAQLRVWFKANQDALLKLYQLVKEVPGAQKYFSADDTKLPPTVTSLLKRLHVTGAQLKRDGELEVIIGGITDNSVGVLFSPADKPPVMSDSGYIWIEALGGNWYLFRTT